MMYREYEHEGVPFTIWVSLNTSTSQVQVTPPASPAFGGALQLINILKSVNHHTLHLEIEGQPVCTDQVMTGQLKTRIAEFKDIAIARIDKRSLDDPLYVLEGLGFEPLISLRTGN